MVVWITPLKTVGEGQAGQLASDPKALAEGAIAETDPCSTIVIVVGKGHCDDIVADIASGTDEDEMVCCSENIEVMDLYTEETLLACQRVVVANTVAVTCAGQDGAA